ncbi:hypothetical protein CDD83_3851 [Cordyceps sp. RAO-2017]|nr:hypothetical protein CDD83_3851 [Cordyceps sp. RAO-2017]
MRFATASSGGRSSLLLLLLSGAFVAVSGLAAEQASSYAPRHRDDRPRYGAQEDLLRPKSPPMSDVLPDYTLIRNPDAWRSQERRNYHDMIARMAKHVDRNPADKLTPALEELKILIETNPRIYMYFVQMFDEIPHRFPYNSDGVGKPVLRDYRHMLQVLNHIVTRGPDVDTVGVPMVIILAYPMGTASGHAAFLDPTVNKAFKKVLREWGHFLLSPASCDVLGTSDSGWFGKQKLHELEQAANAPYHTHKTFEQLFECDPSAESHGYKSWDGKSAAPGP